MMTPRLRLQPEALGVGMTSQRVRDRLIERLRDDGIADERVLNAIRTVPRHLFVDEALATRAYEDTALPIGHGQTISQPWVVSHSFNWIGEFGFSNPVNSRARANVAARCWSSRATAASARVWSSRMPVSLMR